MKCTSAKLCLLLCTLMYSCNSGDTQDINTKSNSQEAQVTFSKLIGIWQNSSNENLFIESWKMINDTLYKGESFILKSNDTIFHEYMNIERTNNEWYYKVKVNGQNNNEAVAFKLTLSSQNQWVFYNPQHDFPNKIMYLKITEDSILASISGTLNGQEKIEQFPMKKIK